MTDKIRHLRLVKEPKKLEQRTLNIVYKQDEQDELEALDRQLKAPMPVALQLPRHFDYNSCIKISPASLGFYDVNSFEHPNTGSPYLRLTNEYSTNIEEEERLTEMTDLIDQIRKGLISFYSEEYLNNVFENSPWSFSSGRSLDSAKPLIYVQTNSPSDLIYQTKRKIYALLQEK